MNYKVMRIKATIAVVALVALLSLTVPATGAGAATTVIVKEKNFKIKLSKKKVRHGKVKFKIKSTGGSHTFCIEGEGVNRCSATVSKGSRTTLKVNLASGRYSYYCSVDGHASLGMSGKLRAV